MNYLIVEIHRQSDLTHFLSRCLVPYFCWEFPAGKNSSLARIEFQLPQSDKMSGSELKTENVFELKRKNVDEPSSYIY